MVRRRLAWLVSVPLMVAGSQVAHSLAYRIVYPVASERDLVLQQTGHGYFAQAPLVGGIGLALLVAAFVGFVVDARDGRVAGRAGRVSLARFAVLPPLGFALQEHFERLLHGGDGVFGAVVEPTFVVGLLLQLPFALLAYLVARLLVRVAERVARVFGTARPQRWAAAYHAARFSSLELAPAPSALALGHAERGPPLLA